MSYLSLGSLLCRSIGIAFWNIEFAEFGSIGSGHRNLLPIPWNSWRSIPKALQKRPLGMQVRR